MNDGCGSGHNGTKPLTFFCPGDYAVEMDTSLQNNRIIIIPMMIKKFIKKKMYIHGFMLRLSVANRKFVQATKIFFFNQIPVFSSYFRWLLRVYGET